MKTLEAFIVAVTLIVIVAAVIVLPFPANAFFIIAVSFSACLLILKRRNQLFS